MLSIFTNPSARAGYDTRSIFKWSLTGLNSEFSFSWTSCLTKAEEPSLPYYLSIAGGIIIGFTPFPRVLVLCEMQSASSRIRVAVSISYDDNHYTTGTSYTMLSIHFLSLLLWHINSEMVNLKNSANDLILKLFENNLKNTKKNCYLSYHFYSSFLHI